MIDVAAKVRARARVNVALKTGILVRRGCDVCGLPKTEAHHPDYTQPLTVRWLCNAHHRELHPRPVRATAETWVTLRLAAGLSQREIERRMGWKAGKLSWIERGVVPSPEEEADLRRVLGAAVLRPDEATA